MENSTLCILIRVLYVLSSKSFPHSCKAHYPDITLALAKSCVLKLPKIPANEARPAPKTNTSMVSNLTALNTSLMDPVGLAPIFGPKVDAAELDLSDGDQRLQQGKSDHAPEDEVVNIPEITSYIYPLLQSQGPLAIRHLVSNLSTSVGGGSAFAALPPPKQRRLIVHVLDSDSRFEKVGWGRWGVKHVNARHASSLPYSTTPNATTISPASSKPSSFTSPRLHDMSSPYLIGIHSPNLLAIGSPGGVAMVSTSSWMGDEGGVFSLDGDDMNDVDRDESTDEEDWRGMGASELRRKGVEVPLPVVQVAHAADVKGKEDDAVQALIGLSDASG